MGCINGKSVLTEEDIDFIAKNTAMDRSKVEVCAMFVRAELLYISLSDNFRQPLKLHNFP